METAPVIGETVSHYRIVEKIGQGGMGEVFLADDTSLHRKVALKFLPRDMQQDAAAHKRFLREAHSAAALDHPFICHINEVAESDGRDFIVMEYVEGRSVKDRLEKAYAERGPGMTYIGCSPFYDPLRAEPRFQALLRRMNLPR